jgi:hypothetical protein
MIRIDVHPVGETWYTQHVRVHDKTYEATFCDDSTELDRFTTSEKKGSRPDS